MKSRAFIQRGGITKIAVPLLMFLTLFAWAFASPVGASPDDDFHLSSIWCGLGERSSLCEDSGDPETRLVPAPLTTATCFAFDPAQSGACWDPDENAEGLVESVRVNTGPLYPPVFYAAMSVFSSTDVQASVMAMRAANAALAVGLLTTLFWVLPRTARTALVVSALASAVPLGLFLIPSTNPSSWALISAITVWLGLWGATKTSGSRQLALCGLALIGGVIGAGARADAAVFAVFGAIVAGILAARWSKALIAPAVTAVLITVVSVAFYMTSGQSSAVVTGLAVGNPPLSFIQHLTNFLNIPGLWTGALGGWGLGWLDTIMPAVVPTLSVAVAAGAIFIGVRTLTWRRASALAIALIAMWLVPLALLAQSRVLVGSSVQPRYILPLLIIALGVATAASHAERWWSGPRGLLAAAALSVAAAIALHTNVRRYTTGIDMPALNPGRDAEWWWPGAPAPIVVWAVGSATFAAALFLLARSARAVRASAETRPELSSTPPAVNA